MSKVPPNFLNRILIKEQEEETGNVTQRKKPRLQCVDSFNLPANSSHASTRTPVANPKGAFAVGGREVKKTPKTEKATVIDDPLAMYRELYSDVTIDEKCSIEADNMQEPRPMNDDCPEAESNLAALMLNNSDEAVKSDHAVKEIFAERKEKLEKQNASTSKYEIVPSSQPEDDPNQSDDITELEQLIASPSASKGKFSINNNSERDSLFAPRALRSHNRPLVSYSLGDSPTTTRISQKITRSFEAQDESDFYIDSPTTRKSKPRITVPKGKIPELPADYDQELEARNFQVKGRKQLNETFGELAIKGYDLYTLRTRQYVNDTVIDTYLKLVAKRSLEDPTHYRKSYAFGTYFYTMLNNGQDLDKLVSWVKDNLFDFELLFLPINQENHWFLFVVDMVVRNYFIYDSLYYGDYTSEMKQLVKFFKHYSMRKDHEIDWDGWPSCPTDEQIGPTQSNGVDCGVFLCQYAEHLSRRAKLDFSQSGMVNYRKIMLYELMRGELIPKFDDSTVTKQEGDKIESALI